MTFSTIIALLVCLTWEVHAGTFPKFKSSSTHVCVSKGSVAPHCYSENGVDTLDFLSDTEGPIRVFASEDGHCFQDTHAVTCHNWKTGLTARSPELGTSRGEGSISFSDQLICGSFEDSSRVSLRCVDWREPTQILWLPAQFARDLDYSELKVSVWGDVVCGVKKKDRMQELICDRPTSDPLDNSKSAPDTSFVDNFDDAWSIDWLASWGNHLCGLRRAVIEKIYLGGLGVFCFSRTLDGKSTVFYNRRDEGVYALKRTEAEYQKLTKVIQISSYGVTFMRKLKITPQNWIVMRALFTPNNESYLEHRWTLNEKSHVTSYEAGDWVGWKGMLCRTGWVRNENLELTCIDESRKKYVYDTPETKWTLRRLFAPKLRLESSRSIQDFFERLKKVIPSKKMAEFDELRKAWEDIGLAFPEDENFHAIMKRRAQVLGASPLLDSLSSDGARKMLDEELHPELRRYL